MPDGLNNLSVAWIDRGVQANSAPDPRYPNGIDLDCSNGAAVTCETSLAYPAPRCGYFLVRCKTCGLEALITTAGRPDDPRSVKLACKIKTEAVA